MKTLIIYLKKIWFWAYDRGTWQYDILCVLILMTIFFTPNVRTRDTRMKWGKGTPIYLSIQETGQGSPEEIKQRAKTLLSQKTGHNVDVSHIELSIDESSNVTGCLIWEK